MMTPLLHPVWGLADARTLSWATSSLRQTLSPEHQGFRVPCRWDHVLRSATPNLPIDLANGPDIPATVSHAVAYRGVRRLLRTLGLCLLFRIETLCDSPALRRDVVCNTPPLLLLLLRSCHTAGL